MNHEAGSHSFESAVRSFSEEVTGRNPQQGVKSQDSTARNPQPKDHNKHKVLLRSLNEQHCLGSHARVIGGYRNEINARSVLRMEVLTFKPRNAITKI